MNQRDMENNYPISKPDEDERFTLGLAIELAEAIESHGYPTLTGWDLVKLQMAVFRFIYEDGSNV